MSYNAENYIFEAISDLEWILSQQSDNRVRADQVEQVLNDLRGFQYDCGF